MLTQDSGGAATSYHSSVPASGYAVASAPLAAPAEAGAARNGVCTSLTARQRDVLAVMMQGKSNKAICRVLDLAEQTVKSHVTGILRALRVTNRTEAVIAVGELGWELPLAESRQLQSASPPCLIGKPGIVV